MGCSECGEKPKTCNKDFTKSVIEIGNPAEVILFHKVLIPASMGDESQTPVTIGKYKNVLMVYEANGHAYLYSSDGIPSKIAFDSGGILFVENLPDVSQASVGFLYITPTGTAAITNDNEEWVTLGDEGTMDFNVLSNRPKYAGVEMTGDTNIPSVEAETSARIAADNSLSSSINSLSSSLSSETAARISADNTLDGKITALDNSLATVAKTGNYNDLANKPIIDTVYNSSSNNAIANSTVTNSLDRDVMTNLALDSSPSTTTVNLNNTKTNLATPSSTTTTSLPLPVASATQAGIMNAATYAAITKNTQDIANIIGEVVAITGLPANPTQAGLTTAWLNASGESALINGAGIYDVTNAKRWTYYSNDTTWYALDASGSITVNPWSNTAAGIVKGSTNVGQIFAENDGTGSVNGWDSLSGQVSTNTSKLATIEQGAQVNVQADWTEADSTADDYIKNKPTVGNGTLTIQNDGTTVGTFDANSVTDVTANIVPPVQIGSTISPAPSTAYVGTNNIIDGAVTTAKLADDAVTTAKINDGAVTADKIDFTTLKKWTPDYSNYGSTNLWANSDTTTITENGFVYAFINAYRVNINSETNIKINGKIVARSKAEARGPNSAVVCDCSGIFPVSSGDIVSYDAHTGSVSSRDCYFIPGKWM